MDKEMLNTWEMIASNVCKLDNAREAANKYKGLCNLQAAMHKELGAVLDDCSEFAKDQRLGKLSFAGYRWYYQGKHINSNEEERTCMDLLANHSQEVEEWEQEDDDTRGKRWGNIYSQTVLYRRFAHVCPTCQYKILRALQAHNVCIDDLGTYYKVVCLYIALKNEQTAVESVAGALGIRLNVAAGSTDTPQAATKTCYGTDTRNSDGNATGRKIQRFMECVPTNNSNRAKRLLAKLQKKGYCDSNYYWNADKWKKGKSRLALAYFAYLASEDLEMSTKEYGAGKATNWKPFDMLFDYDGKENGKNKLRQTKADYMRYNDAFKPKGMNEIKSLF